MTRALHDEAAATANAMEPRRSAIMRIEIIEECNGYRFVGPF
jgi:hypothetical protein